MGILTRAGDLVYTFRFLKLLVTNFEDTDAFKLGLINARGKKLKSATTNDEKSAYTPFHRLVFNIKKLIPAGKIGSYAAALFLLKENFINNEDKIADALEQQGVDTLAFLEEQSSWFIVNENMLSPGNYRLRNDKLINTSYEELAKTNDRVVVKENCYPVGTIFGLDVYEAVHDKSKQPVYVTVGELYK